MTPITLTDAMSDVRLLGAPFQAESFWPWFTVAKLIDGLPLDDREAALFRQCTGRTELPSGPVRRLYLLVGRRGGKDRATSALAVHTAALAHDWSTVLSQGEQGVVLLIGADLKQAKIMRRLLPRPVSGTADRRRSGWHDPRGNRVPQRHVD